MTRAIIKPDLCQACVDCAVARACPAVAVIREEPGDKPWIDFLKCTGCQKCKTVCRGQAMAFLVQPCTGTQRQSW